jgi:pimeloyl-ACP methyl ester carboxylesterase
MVTVRARELDFHVRMEGPVDGRPVLLLHGFPQHGGMWDGVAAELHRAGLRTIAPDQRGYSPGARPSDVDAYRMAEFVADAVALLDALELDTVDVVGHDWGSAVGWHLGAAHAERVRSFTAVSVPHPRSITQAAKLDNDQRERSAYFGLFAIEGKAEEVLLADGGRRLYGLFAPLTPERAEPYVRPLLEPGALTGALNWYRRLERPTIGPAQVPVTFLWGDQDVAIGRDAALGCAEFVAPGVPYRFVEMSGVSHWVPDERPDAVVAEILALVGVP